MENQKNVYSHHGTVGSSGKYSGIISFTKRPSIDESNNAVIDVLSGIADSWLKEGALDISEYSNVKKAYGNWKNFWREQLDSSNLQFKWLDDDRIDLEVDIKNFDLNKL